MSMTRYRVAFSGPMGHSWFDVWNRDEAMRRAQREKAAGAYDVEVMEERPWPPGEETHYVANFVRVWP